MRRVSSSWRVEPVAKLGLLCSARWPQRPHRNFGRCIWNFDLCQFFSGGTWIKVYPAYTFLTFLTWTTPLCQYTYEIQDCPLGRRPWGRPASGKVRERTTWPSSKGASPRHSWPLRLGGRPWCSGREQFRREQGDCNQEALSEKSGNLGTLFLTFSGKIQRIAWRTKKLTLGKRYMTTKVGKDWKLKSNGLFLGKK